MAKKERIKFVMIDILDNWRFWHEYEESKDYEAAGREVIAQANALLAQDQTKNEYAAQLIAEGLEFKRKRSDAGRIGGRASARARKGADDATDEDKDDEVPKAPAPTRNSTAKKIPPPKSRDEVWDYCNEQGIPEGYGIEWWNQNAPRDFHDKDGKPILNWKGALKSFYRAEMKRGK